LLEDSDNIKAGLFFSSILEEVVVVVVVVRYFPTPLRGAPLDVVVSLPDGLLNH